MAISTSASTSTATLKSRPEKGKNEINTKTSPPTKREKFIIRPGRLADFPILAAHNKHVYEGSAVSNFLAPNGHLYPQDQIRGFLQGAQTRYTNPAVITQVACRAADPNTPIAYVQYVRVGTDKGVSDVKNEKSLVTRLWLWVLCWVFWAWHGFSNRVWKDRASDPQNLKTFGGYVDADRVKHWSGPAWKNRWVVQNVVVAKKFHGMGVGSLLLQDVIERSEREGVVVGLSASPHGEYLYRKLGFELMSDFFHRLEGEEDPRGGIMIRYPENWDGERHEKYIGYYDLHLKA